MGIKFCFPILVFRFLLQNWIFGIAQTEINSSKLYFTAPNSFGIEVIPQIQQLLILSCLFLSYHYLFRFGFVFSRPLLHFFCECSEFQSNSIVVTELFLGKNSHFFRIFSHCPLWLIRMAFAKISWHSILSSKQSIYVVRLVQNHGLVLLRTSHL